MNPTGMFSRLMSAVLAAAIFLSLTLPAGAVEEALPAETVPAQTVPMETLPAETLPPETVPIETIPPITVPEESLPEETAPMETVPEETVPEETAPMETVPEETVPEETAPEEKPVQVLSVLQARSLAAGTEGITVRGTVVYANGCQVVLQDDSGGIRLYFDADPATAPGELLQVTGRRTGGLAVEDFESLGTGTLPLVETTLAEAPQALRVKVVAQLTEGPRLSRGDVSLKLSGMISQTGGSWVEAHGVILDGIFYADTLLPAQAPAEETGTMHHFFGQLHAHTGLGGTATPEEAYALAQDAGMDFFAVTVHSDSLENANLGSIKPDGSISPEWAAGRAAAEAASSSAFLALYAYEMSWPEVKEFGHINTFFTQGWQSWEQPAYKDTPENYYGTLALAPGQASMFCHPNPTRGTFQQFGHYTPGNDRQMHLIELGTGEEALREYNKALTKGWHLAPALGMEGNHARTVVLAKTLTQEGLSEAIRSYRVYATEDADLEVTYTLNGSPMGSVLGFPRELKAALSVQDPTDTGPVNLEVMTEAGSVGEWTLDGSYMTFYLPTGHDWYYLRITQTDGDTAVTAPVWVDYFEDMGILSFTADNTHPIQNEQVLLTLTIFNDETKDFHLDKLEFFQNGSSLRKEEHIGIVYGGSSVDYTWPLSREQAGSVRITAKVTGTVEGHTREYQQELTLYIQPKELPISTIEAVRLSAPGEPYRISGYVTAGNHNIYIHFPNTIYVQDDTGGIAVEGQFGDSLQPGRPIEVTGVLWHQDGNRVLELTEYVLPEKTYYRYEPKVLSNSAAMDYAGHGGELLQIEGKVVSLEKTPDGKGLSRLTIEDIRGDLATAVIDPTIGSGAYGENKLASQIKKGRTARIIGLLHADEAGETVLRVRNCDEVVYVPARADPSNPKTGDSLWYWLQWLAAFWEKLW